MPDRAQKSAGPVKLDDDSHFDDDLTVGLSKFTAQSVKSKIPGEVAGDAVVFDLVVKNSSSTIVDLDALVVNLYGSDGVAGSRLTTKPAKIIPDAVGAHSAARGRYVFVLPIKDRRPVRVEVSLSADQPVLNFRGTVT